MLYLGPVEETHQQERDLNLRDESFKGQKAST